MSKNWYFSRKKNLLDLSKLYAGFGTLLIEGDSLIHYLLEENNQVLLTKNYLNNFIEKKLKECGFNKLRIVFFQNHSKYISSNMNICLGGDCYDTLLFSDLSKYLLVFKSYEDDSLWTDFVKIENISLMLVSESNIYAKADMQYTFMHYLCTENKMQLAIIDKMSLFDLRLKAFVIFATKEYLFQENKEQPLINSIETSFEPLKIDDNYNKDVEIIDKFGNEKLNKILSLSDDDNNNNNNMDKMTVNFEWELKLSYQNPNKEKIFKHSNIYIQKQKYSRYMEKYAESLISSRNLHHPIVTNNNNKSTSTNLKAEKISSKAGAIIQKNMNQGIKLKEEKEISFLNEIKNKITCYEDIDNELKFVNSNDSSEKFKFELIRLKIKWLQNEISGKIKKKLNLYLLITEIIQNYFKYLIDDHVEAEKLLICLKNIGFESTTQYLIDFLTKKQNFKSFTKINECANTFNHDILFQLEHCGDLLKRTLNSSFDSRVRFMPDEWQKKLLDIVDKNESALVCCPTSSGKTFISYYIMEKALRENNEDIVVFISPIKALANQVTAEIYARFGSKQYPKNSDKFTYAMCMPDYVINDPLKCQLLVTVPTSFESMLSENRPEWQKKIKYIIIDEIQTINDSDLGYSIDKIIHMINCPILVLSATIGNLDPFYDWISAIQLKKGIRMHKIVHKERFCDLKKYLFVPNDEKIISLNELFGYSENNLFKTDKISSEFHLLSSEIIEILNVLTSICVTDKQKSLLESIQPEKFFRNIFINKNEVKNYEQFIINSLKSWLQNEYLSSNEINKFFQIINQNCEKAFDHINKIYGNFFSSSEWGINHIYELVKSLHDKKMLPAIVFLNSCDECDILAKKLTQHLIDLEDSDKKFQINEKLNKKVAKIALNLEKHQKKSKNDNSLDNQDLDSIKSQSFVDRNKYTFFDMKYKLTETELNDEIHEHRHRKIPSILFEGWKRGIGVHHANFHTK